MKKTRSRTLLGVLGLLLAAVLVLCTMGLFAGCSDDEEPVEGGGDNGAVTYSLNVFAGGFGMNFFVGGTVTTNNINVEVVPSDNSGNIDIKAGDGKDDFVIYDENKNSNSDGSVTITSANFTVYVEYTGEKYDFGTNSKVGSLNISSYIHYGDAIVIVPASYGISNNYSAWVKAGDSVSAATVWLQYDSTVEGGPSYSDKAAITAHVQHYDSNGTKLLDASSDDNYDTFTYGWNAIVATSDIQKSDKSTLSETLPIYIDDYGDIYTGTAESMTAYDITSAPSYDSSKSALPQTETKRVYGSAEINHTYTLGESSTVFGGSSVTATATTDAQGTVTYTLSGTAGILSSDQATAWGDSSVSGKAYFCFTVRVNDGEYATVASYSSSNETNASDKFVIGTDSSSNTGFESAEKTDGNFILGVKSEGSSTWHMDVTIYDSSNQSVASFTIVYEVPTVFEPTSST